MNQVASELQQSAGWDSVHYLAIDSSPVFLLSMISAPRIALVDGDTEQVPILSDLFHQSCLLTL